MKLKSTQNKLMLSFIVLAVMIFLCRILSFRESVKIIAEKI
jgi:hypothetical protein